MGAVSSGIEVALKHYEAGKKIEAEAVARHILVADAGNSAAWNLIGVICSQGNRDDEAAKAYSELVKLQPEMSIAWANLSRSLFKLGEVERAVEAICKAIDIDATVPSYFDILIILSRDLPATPLEALNGAIGKLIDRLQDKNSDSGLFVSLHKLWVAVGNVNQAINAGLMAIASDPTNVDLKISFAGFLFRHSKVTQASKLYAEVAEENPSCSEAWLGFGACNHDMSNLAVAKEAYEKALEIKPSCKGANKNLGTLLAFERNFEEAIKRLEVCIDLDTSELGAQLQLYSYRRHICDWSFIDSERAFKDLLFRYQGTDVSPFQAMPLYDSPQLQKTLSAKWRSGLQTKRLRLDHENRSNGKIRVGWFSNDFHDHATMFLMAGLFREYDRSKFEYYVYSYGTTKTGVYRGRLESQVDKFECFAQHNDESIIESARADNLDIAVDLKGYTNGGRYHLFSQGVAPIQISYLGYPGTSGSPHFDYLVADSTVIPDSLRTYYSEQLMLMPNCYQPNDCEREISGAAINRAEVGLPEDAVVLACFNQSYKISPVELRVWARLLKKVPSSVLWLYVTNDTAKDNLRREIEDLGVDPKRLIFAGMVENSEHLARCRLADVFLDCFNVNAHTTASDALWAGVPVVTLPGEQFAARVAASIVSAAGLNELVAVSIEDYFDKVLKIASDKKYRQDLRQKVEDARKNSPLFDTVQYCRDLESLFVNAFQRSADKLAPIDLSTKVN